MESFAMKTMSVHSHQDLHGDATKKSTANGFSPYGSVPVWVRTLAFCGVALCAAAPRPSHAQAVGTEASSPTTVYVDCAAASRGNGSAARPYWRITDALEKARALRRRSPGRITVRVAPGNCSGNFETQPAGQETRPPELLPLVLNVPDLTLHGAGIVEYGDGFPVGLRTGTATTVTVDTQRLGLFDNTVIYVGPTTDGGRADGTVIEGLEIDDAFNSYYGMFINRTQRIIIRGNVVEHVNWGALVSTESSGRIVGNVVHDGFPGMLFAAGSASSPARLYVGSNTIDKNNDSVLFFGTSMYTEQLDMGANPLAELAYPINPTVSQIGDHLEVEFEGNEVSNSEIGLRLMILGGGKYPYAQTGNISASVHDNRFIDNSVFQFTIDEGYVFRGTSTYWTNPDPEDFPAGYLGFLAAPFVTHGPFDGPYSGSVSAVFEHNVWQNPNVTPLAPAFLTFSGTNVYDFNTGEPDPSLVPLYPYMRNSRLNLVDHDGLFSQPGVVRDDLRLYDPFDGVALLNQTRIRR
jgi:Right handed beta helix region